MVKKITLRLLDYPILDDHTELNLVPSQVFRVEGVPFLHPEGEFFGNVLVMFTGLMATDKGADLLQCVPISFYGSNDKNLSKLFKGRDLWVEIGYLEDNPYVDTMAEMGYWN